MRLPRLIVVTDWSLPEASHWAALEAVAGLGPEVAIQHRDPGAPVRTFLERGRRLLGLCRTSGAQLCINGRLEVAVVLGTHLHLPVDGPRPAEARPFLVPERWISAAVHSEQELLAASGADCVLLSPVFAPGSKPADLRPPLGMEGFRALSVRASVPAYALGGMTADRVRALGPCAGVAAQSAVLGAPDPASSARAILAALQ
jgi:thiamine-phosphate pyrophosphorylase